MNQITADNQPVNVVIIPDEIIREKATADLVLSSLEEYDKTIEFMQKEKLIHKPFKDKSFIQI